MTNAETPDARADPGRRRPGRPPRARAGAGPAAGFDSRERLLRTGLAMLTEKGYSATTIDQILVGADVPKGSFYHHFDGKEAFGQALLDAYQRYFAARLDRWFLDQALDPLERLDGFIEDAKRGIRRHDYRRGCLVGNLGQEVGALPASFRAPLVAILADWQRRTATLVAAGIAIGRFRPRQRADDLADLFWIGWEGAVLRARLERDVAPLGRFRDAFVCLLRLAPAGAEAASPAARAIDRREPTPFISPQEDADVPRTADRQEG